MIPIIAIAVVIVVGVVVGSVGMGVFAHTQTRNGDAV